MNLKCKIYVLIAVLTLCTRVYGDGSTPIIGDATTASKWTIRGDTLSSAGNWAGARAAYQNALNACHLDIARLGLARADYALGDYQGAVDNYQILYQNEPNIESKGIRQSDVMVEYTLTLQKMGNVSAAIAFYNGAVDVTQDHFQRDHQNIDLPTYRADGSDYDPAVFSAMAHVICALGWNGYAAKELTEAQAALTLAPNSSVVKGYAYSIMAKAKAEQAEEAKLQVKEQQKAAAACAQNSTASVPSATAK